MNDINDQDKLMAALSYPTFGIVSIIILLVEDMKKRPFQKYHAVQSLAVAIILWILFVIFGCALSFLIVPICIPAAFWLVTLYWAYKAYQGEYFEIPALTDFLKGQGWI